MPVLNEIISETCAQKQFDVDCIFMQLCQSMNVPWDWTTVIFMQCALTQLPALNVLVRVGILVMDVFAQVRSALECTFAWTSPRYCMTAQS